MLSWETYNSLTVSCILTLAGQRAHSVNQNETYPMHPAQKCVCTQRLSAAYNSNSRRFYIFDVNYFNHTPV